MSPFDALSAVSLVVALILVGRAATLVVRVRDRKTEVGLRASGWQAHGSDELKVEAPSFVLTWVARVGLALVAVGLIRLLDALRVGAGQ